ncbi:MAG: hypothetical protein LC135_04810 [Phycisphaerae bacterium]|nr:hypothetical protein [Phycisphaerae bacterium]MCZ2399175.1 hypothetical protein [Phycisphaerae bacterium]
MDRTADQMYAAGGRANPKNVLLLMAAVLTFAAAVVVWLWRGERSALPDDAGSRVSFHCEACDQRFTMSAAELERALESGLSAGPGAAMPTQGKLPCKLCGKRTAVQISESRPAAPGP